MAAGWGENKHPEVTGRKPELETTLCCGRGPCRLRHAAHVYAAWMSSVLKELQAKTALFPRRHTLDIQQPSSGLPCRQLSGTRLVAT